METKEKMSIKESVAFYIQRFRIPLFGLMGLLVVGIIGAIVVEEIQKSYTASSTAIIEELEDAFSTLTTTKDETEKTVFQKNFDMISSKIDIQFAGTFAQQRSDYLRGNLKFISKDFSAAELAYLKAAKDFSAGYLTPIALMNAAIAAEEAGNINNAQTYLTEIVRANAKDSPMAIRALFSLGRLAESGKNWIAARDAYQKIIDGYVFSNWTKLARDRIIFMKALGLV